MEVNDDMTPVGEFEDKNSIGQEVLPNSLPLGQQENNKDDTTGSPTRNREREETHKETLTDEAEQSENEDNIRVLTPVDLQPTVMVRDSKEQAVTLSHKVAQAEISVDMTVVELNESANDDDGDDDKASENAEAQDKRSDENDTKETDGNRVMVASNDTDERNYDVTDEVADDYADYFDGDKSAVVEKPTSRMGSCEPNEIGGVVVDNDNSVGDIDDNHNKEGSVGDDYNIKNVGDFDNNERNVGDNEDAQGDDNNENESSVAPSELVQPEEEADDTESSAIQNEAETYWINLEAEKQDGHEPREENVELENNICDLKTKLAETEAQKSELESKFQSLREENEAQKIKIKDLETELAETNIVGGDQAKVLEDAQQKVRDLEDQLVRLAKDDDVKSKKLAKIEKDLMDMTEKCRKLEQEMKENPPIQAPKSKACVIM